MRAKWWVITLLIGSGGVVLGAVSGLLLTSPRAAAPAGGSDGAATSGASAEDAAPAAGEGDNPYAVFRLADFELMDREGRAVGPEAFEGEVTALAFFFTSCRGPCPALIASMIRLETATEGIGLRLAAVSVDGERDTPEVLRAYASRVGIDGPRWTLLTGPPSAVRALALESLGYEIREDPAAPIISPTGEAMPNIVHPTRLLLIGPDRRAIGAYAFDNAGEQARLVADARAALGDAGP